VSQLPGWSGGAQTTFFFLNTQGNTAHGEAAFIGRKLSSKKSPADTGCNAPPPAP